MQVSLYMVNLPNASNCPSAGSFNSSIPIRNEKQNAIKNHNIPWNSDRSISKYVSNLICCICGDFIVPYRFYIFPDTEVLVLSLRNDI